jgi:signal peptidase II
MKSYWRITSGAVFILLLDQLTKLAVVKYLGYESEKIILPGFFKIVLWGNTGAAWNIFQGRNTMLAVVAIAALGLLFSMKNIFMNNGFAGRLSLMLLFGGIIGNMTDRLLRRHVVDFLYFFIVRRDGSELGFPAFNSADSAITIGVAFLLLSALRKDS